MSIANTHTNFISILYDYFPQTFLFFFFSCTFFSAQIHHDSNFGIIFLISTLPITLFVITVISLFINKYFPHKTFLLFLILFTLIIKTLWIIKIDSAPLTDDFSLIYNAAVKLSKGDYSFMQSELFSFWNYQLGYTIYQAILIKAFGEGTLLIKLMNMLYSTGTTILIYLIAKKVFSEFSGKISALLYTIYLPSIIMSSVLTNQHLATFLFYLGLYFLITTQANNNYHDYGMGILFSLGNIIRPLGPIVLMSAILYIIVQGISRGFRSNATITLKRLSKIILSYFIVYYMLSFLVINMGITEHTLTKDREPLWKFTIGLNHQTTGRYSQEDKELVLQFPIGEERNRAEKELIKERVKNKKKLAILFKNKFEKMWGESHLSTYYAFYGTNHHYLLETMLKYEGFIYYIIISLCIISMMHPSSFRKDTILLFFFLLFLYIGIHFFIEIQARYRYFIYPLFFIIAGNGVHVIYQFMRKPKTNAIK